MPTLGMSQLLLMDISLEAEYGMPTELLLINGCRYTLGFLLRVLLGRMAAWHRPPVRPGLVLIPQHICCVHSALPASGLEEMSNSPPTES